MDHFTADTGKLRDENEQLRTALESALDENVELTDDRERLLRRVSALATELRNAAISHRQAMQDEADVQAADAAMRAVEAAAAQSQTQEELRVAFEELQVLAEELEVANTSLQHANERLETRVSERTREIADAGEALKQSEARFRTLVEGMPQLVWRSAGMGRWTWSSPQWQDYTGQSQAKSTGLGWLEAVHPADRGAATDAWAVATESGIFDVEARICGAPAGRYRHFRTRAAPVRGSGGAIVEWLGTSTDVDDIIRLQEQQAMLVDELQHRTRNLMAVVQAVMMRTIKGSDSLDDFEPRINDRMQALARVQGLLSRRNIGERVTFDALLRDELGAHIGLGEQRGDQVKMDGPDGVPLRSAVVQTFALALHELTTNAIKYGALSNPKGRLAVRWRIDPAEKDGMSRLSVDWRESGMTDVPRDADAPRGTGYGRELIERALPYQLGAQTSFSFTEDGVHCTIAVDVEDEKIRETIDG